MKVQTDADFYADTYNFKERNKMFWGYFVRGNSQVMESYPACSFIEE